MQPCEGPCLPTPGYQILHDPEPAMAPVPLPITPCNCSGPSLPAAASSCVHLLREEPFVVQKRWRRKKWRCKDQVDTAAKCPKTKSHRQQCPSGHGDTRCGLDSPRPQELRWGFCRHPEPLLVLPAPSHFLVPRRHDKEWAKRKLKAPRPPLFIAKYLT